MMIPAIDRRDFHLCSLLSLLVVVVRVPEAVAP